MNLCRQLIRYVSFLLIILPQGRPLRWKVRHPAFKPWAAAVRPVAIATSMNPFASVFREFVSTAYQVCFLKNLIKTTVVYCLYSWSRTGIWLTINSCINLIKELKKLIIQSTIKWGKTQENEKPDWIIDELFCPMKIICSIINVCILDHRKFVQC
jgi:hypothetical protein